MNLSFYGVGNGTTVEYVQAYNGSDDGFEFFVISFGEALTFSSTIP